MVKNKIRGIQIHGRRADLIEIEGDIYDEIGWRGNGKCYISISDGTTISVEYNDMGIWHIEVLREGVADIAIKRAEDGKDNYFDTITLSGVPFKWLIYGGEVIR